MLHPLDMRFEVDRAGIAARISRGREAYEVTGIALAREIGGYQELTPTINNYDDGSGISRRVRTSMQYAIRLLKESRVIH